MTEGAPPPPTGEADFPVAEVQPAGWSFGRWLRRTWPIWVIGLASLGVAAALVMISQGSSGPRIVVKFAEGHGIKPGDRLRHRGIDVGEVTGVELGPRLEDVLITVELAPAAHGIARQGSRFWIERPRISLSRISGLETVVGAKYVGVLPGPPDAAPQFEFEGMDTPPLFHNADSVEITVQFQNGYGLAAGDVVKHRGIVVGEVASVEPDPKFQSIEVRVRLIGRATGFARAGSQFWIERPRLSIAEVRGLETLIGGRFLAVLPGSPNGKPQRSFVGLESAPQGELPAGGLEILLQGSIKHGLAPGTPVLYRGQHVGRILSVGLAHDAASVDARAYIQPDYRNLIRDNTQFWSNSGLQLRLGLSGLEFNTETLSSLALGGVTFATPTSPGKPVTTGHRFPIAAKPDSDWLEWQPRIAVGAGLIGNGVSMPSPQRASLRWSESFLGIGRTKRRQGWVLVLDKGRELLGPADLLTPAQEADDETILEVSGREIKITKGKAKVVDGIAFYSIEGEPISPESAWPIKRLRSPEELESSLLIADPQTPKVPLAAARLSPSEDQKTWLIDSSVPIDGSWHGACLISVKDGDLIGIVLADETPARVAVIPPKLEIP